MADDKIPVAGMGAEGVPLLKGLDGVLRSTEAASQAVKEAAGELKVVAQRTGQFGPGGAESREVSNGIAVNAERETLYSQIVAAGGNPEQAAKFAGVAAPVRTVEAPAPAAPPPTATSTSGHSDQETFEHYRDYFGGKGGFSLRNLRRDVGQRVVSGTEPNWGDQFYQSPDGEWVDGNGNIASSGALMAFMRRGKIAGAARGFGQALAEGGSLRSAGVGALPGIAAKGAGIASAAIYAGQAAGNFMEDQRAANAEWQSIYGGSNLGAIGQRFSQKLFGLSQFGFMDSKQAEQLFRATSETGLQGDERQGALDFATGMYSELGMNVNQSIKVIELAVKSGNESLMGFAGAIRDVSESAVEAGVNAEKARELFIKNAEQIAGQIGGGNSSTQIAAAITAEQVNLGPEFMGMEFGYTDEAAVRRMQGMTGMDASEILTMAEQNPGQYFQTLMPMLQKEASRFFKGNAAYQQAQKIIRDGFAAGRDINTITNQVRNLLIDPFALRNMLAQFGVKTEDTFQAAAYIVAMVGDQIHPEERIAEQEAEVQVQSIRGKDEISARNEWLDEHSLEKGGFFNTGILGNADAQRLNQALRHHVSRTGQIEGLVGKLFEEGGIESIDKVAIQTKDGLKVMDLADAVSAYGDQINAGNAVVVGGDKAGMTIADAVGGGHSDPTAASGVPVDAGRGEDLDSYMKREGNVVLGLTPEARRILDLASLSGAVSWDEYYSQSDQHRTQESYASGNP